MSTIGMHHLRHLALFALTVEEQSFAAAARRAKTSRSRVSEQITELEEQLGVRLFHRSTRQLSLTDEGHQVYEEARNLDGILQTISDIAHQDMPKGRIKITTTIDLGVDMLTPVIQRFNAEYPDIHFEIQLSDERLDLIREGIDLGIRVGLPGRKAPNSRELYRDHFSIFASPDLLAQHDKITGIAQLNTLPWCLFALPDGASSLAPGQTNQLGGSEPVPLNPSIRHQCNSPIMMLHMMLNGLGLGFALHSVVHRYIEQGKLVPVLPEIRGQECAFQIVYPSHRHMPLRVQTFIDFLQNSPEFSGRHVPA